jgi:hypothetical protein
VTVVEALGIAVVLGRHPVDTGVTVRRSVGQAGVEERGAHAMIAEGQIHEEVIHHQDAIGNQGVEAGVEAGETLKPPTRVGHELHPASRLLLEEVEQGFDLRIGWEWGSVESEVALDQLDQLRAIFAFSRTDHHRASLASL